MWRVFYNIKQYSVYKYQYELIYLNSELAAVSKGHMKLWPHAAQAEGLGEQTLWYSTCRQTKPEKIILFAVCWVFSINEADLLVYLLGPIGKIWY